MSDEFERVRVVLPAHQAFQVKQWAEIATAKLHAKEVDLPAKPIFFRSENCVDKWGNPRTEVILRPQFDEPYGWRVGWACIGDRSVDEWLVGRKTKAGWPWYRPSAIQSSEAKVACALAARAVKIVLEQMKEHASDQGGVDSIQWVQDRLEAQAREWLQHPLEFPEIAPIPNSRYEVKPGGRGFRSGTGKVIVLRVCEKTRTCWAYQDKPVTYKRNRSGREVVDFDPRCIQTCYSWSELQSAS